MKNNNISFLILIFIISFTAFSLYAQDPHLHVEGNVLIEPGNTKLHISKFDTSGSDLGVSIGIGENISNQILAINLVTVDTSFHVDLGECAMIWSKGLFNKEAITFEAEDENGNRSPGLNFAAFDSSMFISFAEQSFNFAQAMVKHKMKNGKFTIQTNKPNIEVSWLVIGDPKR